MVSVYTPETGTSGSVYAKILDSEYSMFLFSWGMLYTLDWSDFIVLWSS